MTTAPHRRPRPSAVEAYLRRLGVADEPPSARALGRLHAAQVERVPYETFWLHLGQRWDIDPLAALDRVAFEHRGGYCFHLNGALALVLEHLGYRVTRHVAGVHDDTGPSAASMGNHVALVVHDVPAPECPTGQWYVDAGLGDVLHEPLPLTPGVSTQGHLTFTVERVDRGPDAGVGAGAGVGDWHVACSPGGSLAGVSMDARSVTLDMFAERHTFNATSPQSSFARTVTAQRRHGRGTDVMRGCVLTLHHDDVTTTETLTTQRDWTAALADHFGLHRPGPLRALDALWRRVVVAHEQWLATPRHEEVAA